MSSRALRRLREEKLQEALLLASTKNQTIDSNEEEDDELSESGEDDDDDQSSDASSIYEESGPVPRKKTQSTFTTLLMMDDSDEDSSDEDSSDEDSSEEESVSDGKGGGYEGNEDNESEDEDSLGNETKNKNKPASLQATKGTMKKKGKSIKANIDEQEKEEEDFDAILSEFQADDIQNQKQSAGANNGDIELNDGRGTLKHLLLNGIDTREYDLEYSLRSMLGGGGGAENVNNVVRVAGGGGGRRKNVIIQKRCLFAQGREEWGKRPSSYIGGGLGMDVVTFGSTKNHEDDSEDDESYEQTSPTSQPWPYNNEQQILASSQHYIQHFSTWHAFQRSTTYASKLEEFETYISRTGDINTLAMFLIDNPFIVEPMLQLAMFFFHTRENEKGTELVKRILWILECACTSGFLPPATASSRQSSNDAMSSKLMMMDHELEQNAIFFETLTLLVKNSSMVGCVNTSLAASRLLLSLDPLRDPMGMLMIMDYFALASLKEVNYKFVIKMIESEMVGFHAVQVPTFELLLFVTSTLIQKLSHLCSQIKIYHKATNNGEEKTFSCDLINMPNWSFSYALALYKQSYALSFDDEEEDERMRSKATEALQSAILSYPMIPKLLLEKNQVNITGRSFQTDWPSVLSPLGEINDEVRSFEAIQAECFARDYERTKEKITQIFIERSHKLWCGDDVVKWLYDCCAEVVTRRNETNLFDESKILPLALLRYLKFDPTEFLDSFPNIPAANVLDPMLVDLAMHVRPNARRMLRMPNQQRGEMGGDFNEIEQRAMQQMRTLLGTGRDGMEVIDPDLPIAEIYWRSMMPWARVDGVPPGRQ